MAIKGSSFVLILILGSLVSASFGGGQRKLLNEHKAQEDVNQEEIQKELLENEQTFAVHPRMLKVQTNDYGNYDPSPAMVKPPFKLIPN